MTVTDDRNTDGLLRIPTLGGNAKYWADTHMAHALEILNNDRAGAWWHLQEAKRFQQMLTEQDAD